jgi:hypothetical protein
MATSTLIKHGTDKGYRAESRVGEVCERCRNAHRVYQTQFRAQGRAKGLKYNATDVIDHLYKASRPERQRSVSRPVVSNGAPEPADKPAEPDREGRIEPSLGDRLSARIRDLTVGPGPAEPVYVNDDDLGYVHEIDDVDQPGPEWEPVKDEEFIINAQGLAKIQENLGTYLSIVGMTVEMIDPYCGPIFAQNFENIVSHWSKVIAHYPKAAELFLDGKGGIIFTWIGALQATWPFLYAIYQHHLARTITVGPDGKIYRKGEMPNPMNNGQVIDPLQPQFQYSAT